MHKDLKKTFLFVIITFFGIMIQQITFQKYNLYIWHLTF